MAAGVAFTIVVATLWRLLLNRRHEFDSVPLGLGRVVGYSGPLAGPAESRPAAVATTAPSSGLEHG